MTENTEHGTAALIERLGRLAFCDAYRDGLKPVHWEALRYLERCNRFSNTAASLTSYLGLTKGTVSQSIGALADKGLVRKQADARDKRTIRLFLTAAGKAALDKDPLHQMAQALEPLSPALRHSLHEGLEQLLRQRMLAQDRSPFGLCRRCRYFAVDHPDGAPHRCELLGEALTSFDAEHICVEQTSP